MLGRTRPMDNIKLGFDLPQEDEHATCLLSGGISPYMAYYYMSNWREFEDYFAFKKDSDEKMRWRESFLFLMKKLTLRAARRGESPRFVLKSPVHTARIPLLLELFPKAKFVYISRHPYDVFSSACHMADTTYWHTYLNTPTDEQVQGFILTQYDILWDEYEDGAGEIDEEGGDVLVCSRSSMEVYDASRDTSASVGRVRAKPPKGMPLF